MSCTQSTGESGRTLLSRLRGPGWLNRVDSIWRQVSTYCKFIGPGLMVSVAYMDPGNYATAVSAGAMFEYKLLFVVLSSSIFAVLFQVLCARLGIATGLNLAENCRRHLPPWLNMTLYIFTEIGIIATDLAEVIGTVISLEILFNIPLPVGVILTVTDVLIVLAAYRPGGPVKLLRYFEGFVSLFVIATVVCFAVELYNVSPLDTAKVLRGFLPSTELLKPQGIYISCAILGATVMPHSLYLGSGLVQPRLKEFDIHQGRYTPSADPNNEAEAKEYKPSMASINYCMKYTIVELVVSLCTVAIFVNSAILIVAGATLYQTAEAIDADLYSIYHMLVQHLGQIAGTVFALALLFSGQSAGIVCTLAGQMVSEGFVNWTVRPWLRRTITRGIAILPCLFVSLFVGRRGLAQVLNSSQVILSMTLPIVTAPIIYFTSSRKIMRVDVEAHDLGDFEYSSITESGQHIRDLSNSKTMNAVACTVFVLVSALNIYLVVSTGF